MRRRLRPPDAELYEETGALDYALTPLCDYSVQRENGLSYGRVFAADIRTLGPLPESEIAETRLFDALPDDLTYPFITPGLYDFYRGGNYTMLRVAMISKWHVHAAGYAKFVQQQRRRLHHLRLGRARLSAAAPGRRSWAFPSSKPITTRCLARADVDAVLIRHAHQYASRRS